MKNEGRLDGWVGFGCEDVGGYLRWVMRDGRNAYIKLF
jgi:hypothetical protein